jgi:hypothetical protein
MKSWAKHIFNKALSKKKQLFQYAKLNKKKLLRKEVKTYF